MNIVLSPFIIDESNIDIDLDQLFVTIESYYHFKNKGQFIIFTNNDSIISNIKIFNNTFNYNVITEKIDFEKEWEKTGLKINSIKTRRSFIISKMIIPFIFNEDYLFMDWDILTTGQYNNEIIKSNKLRFFNPKFYDGLTLRQLSLYKGLSPEDERIGRFHWVNSGFVYFPKDLTKKLILEYWNKFDNIKEKKYKDIVLFDIVGDELIYNLMMLDRHSMVEECLQYNINVVSRNFYFLFNHIKSMENFGKNFPYVLNFHFAVGHVKPFNIIIDDKGRLHYKIILENYNLEPDVIKWCLDMGQHRMGSHHYNALIFGIIWQYRRYLIQEKMGLSNKKESEKYLEFFNKSIVDEK